MKEEGNDPPARSRRAGFLSNALVSTQVAVSMILLVAAGLLTRGFFQVRATATGFEMHNVVTAAFDLTAAGYDEPRARDFHQRLRDRVAALPGIDGVAAVSIIPLNSDFNSHGLQVKDTKAAVRMEENRVTPGFFSLVRIPIVRGRNFSGASGGRVLRMIVRRAMRPVAVGAIAGIAGAAAVSNVLVDLLYGVSPFDPLAFLAVPALLMTVALLACYLPARRAMRVNPVDALRCG